jgi:hypothetical protein
MNFTSTPSSSAATISLKLIFVKLIVPGDPKVDLERVDRTVDAVDTATSTISLFFKGVETLLGAFSRGVDLLRDPRFAADAEAARLGGILITKNKIVRPKYYILSLFRSITGITTNSMKREYSHEHGILTGLKRSDGNSFFS